MIRQAGRNLRLFHVPDFGKIVSGDIRTEFERDSEITEPDRQSRKKKMVTAYAAKEQKRYHEKSEVDEKSMEDFREEIKGKTKREQYAKRTEEIKIPAFL